MAKFVFALMCVCLLLSSAQLANAQQYKYVMRPLSSVGKVTGGKCNQNKECVNGYTSKDQKKFTMLCLTRKQAGKRVVDDSHVPNYGLTCGCLPDVHHCGYIEPEYLGR